MAKQLQRKPVEKPQPPDEEATREVKPAPAATAPTPVRPVANAIAILRYLDNAGFPDNVTNIARTLRINTSTCFNILRTLAAEGIVDFDERSKGYSIGLGIIRLAQSALSEGGKIDAVRPAIERIADAYAVTVSLWRLTRNDRSVLVSVTQSTAPFQIQMQIGQRLPLYIGALGRVLAFHHGVSKRDLLAHFKKLRWSNAPSFEDYWQDVQAVSDRGWALDDGNFAKGAATLGVPVFDRSGALSHGMVATMFQDQLRSDRLASLAREMIDLSRDISGLF